MFRPQASTEGDVDDASNEAREYLQGLLRLTPEQQEELWDYVLGSSNILNQERRTDFPSNYIEFLRILGSIFKKFGIVPEDIPHTLFFQRVRTLCDKGSHRALFDTKFLSFLKQKLYGNRNLPIPLDATSLSQHTRRSLESRQKAIENITWRLNVEFVTKQLVSKSYKRQPQYGSLFPIWVNALSAAIAIERRQCPQSVLQFPLASNQTALVTLSSFLTLMTQPASQRASHRDKTPEQLQNFLDEEHFKLLEENEHLAELVLEDPENEAVEFKEQSYSDSLAPEPETKRTLNPAPLDTIANRDKAGENVVPSIRLVKGIARALQDQLALGEHKMANKKSARCDQVPYDAEHLTGSSSHNTEAQFSWTMAHAVKVGSLLLDKLIRVLYISLPIDEARRVVDARTAMSKYYKKKEDAAEKAAILANSLWIGDDCYHQFSAQPLVRPRYEIPTTSLESASVIPFSQAITSSRSDFMVVPDAVWKSGTTPSRVWVQAFRHRVIRLGLNKSLGLVIMPDITRRVLQDNVLNKLLREHSVPYQPMIVPALPWDPHTNRGAYYMHPPHFVRTMAWSHQFSQRLTGNSDDLQKLADTVTRLGHVPWRIHSPTLSIVEKMWQGGGDIVGIPRSSLFPAVKPPDIQSDISEERDNQIRLFRQERYKTRTANRRLASDIPSFLLRLNTAKCFNHVPRLYFPHALDFRGRAYPVPPHLNHQGGDLARSLLVFAEPKRLGASGLRWLKIHVAGLFGHDKKTLQEREAWTTSHLHVFSAVAKDPLSASSMDFWCGADKPWQALTASFELARVFASDSPEDAESSLPIHQDGTCNGLQHYAAIGRDVEGGKSVNLYPSDAPADVYTAVMHECERKIERLASNNLSDDMLLGRPRHTLARFVLDHNLLVRKVVKTTVMTICYGVTQFGANEQVEKHLIAQHGEIVTSEPLLARALGRLIAATIIQSVDTLFVNAMRIKKWLDDISVACSLAGITVSWIAPSGLPCIQPYVDKRTRSIATKLQCMSIPVEERFQKINKRKQKAGLPPNFIHSLDASHMLFVAQRCFDQGLRFAAVHDSFWTHAADVDVMNRITREEFVRLHSMPLLNNLYTTLCYRGVGALGKLDPPPKVGKLDLSEILRSTYFFS